MNRRRQQSGTTLVELLVSIAIIGVALSLMVGTFASAVLLAQQAKKLAVEQAIYQYEVDRIGAYAWDTTNGTPPAAHTDCFTVEDAPTPSVPAAGPPCASGTLRADVFVVVPAAAGIEELAIVVVDGKAPLEPQPTVTECQAGGAAVCVYKDQR
jgi:prepilin-type N-terminal cleavage/methylation domain-containing protein